MRAPYSRTLFDLLGEQAYASDIAALVPEAAARPHGAWQSPTYPHLKLVVLIGQGGLDGAMTDANFLEAHQPLEALPPGDGARPHDVALVLYTSGSSANPKAVPLCHGATIENGFNIGERQGLQAGDGVFVTSPLFWSFGSANAMCATFTHGGTLVVQGRFDAGEAIELIERHRCRSIYTLPGITSAILLHPSFRAERTASLRIGVTIGSPKDVVDAA